MFTIGVSVSSSRSRSLWRSPTSLPPQRPSSIPSLPSIPGVSDISTAPGPTAASTDFPLYHRGQSPLLSRLSGHPTAPASDPRPKPTDPWSGTSSPIAGNLSSSLRKPYLPRVALDPFPDRPPGSGVQKPVYRDFRASFPLR